MSSVKFSNSELADMLKFYQSQYSEVVARLNHIQSVLSKLSGAVVETTVEEVVIVAEAEPKVPAKRGRKPNAAVAAPVSKTRRKRGRQPIWAEMILKSLKKFDRPLTYKDLIREAKIQGGVVGEDKDEKIKAAINQSVNRLKNKNKKIKSVRVPGKTGTFLALNKWLDESGNLIDEYVRRLS